MKGGRVFYNGAAGEATNKTKPDEYDFMSRLAAHHCPVWVIDGDHDCVDAGGKKFQMAAEKSSNIHVAVIKDASHAEWIDAPTEFSAALSGALASGTHCR